MLTGPDYRGIGERLQCNQDRLVLFMATAGGQVEVVVQGEDVLRILNPRREFVPPAGAEHDETRGLSYLLLEVGERLEPVLRRGRVGGSSGRCRSPRGG